MKKSKGVGISTDHIAINIWMSLLEDLQLQDVFAPARQALIKGDLKTFREKCEREVGIVAPERYKAVHQVVNLLKKYRFEKDVYTDEELVDLTNQKFLTNQVIMSEKRKAPCSYRADLVLREARRIIKGILGDYCPEETERLSKFGKKSSIGCPLSLAYIDHKLTNEQAFSGSKECTKWFFSMLEKDPILKRIVSRLRVRPGDKNLEYEFLHLVNVPKKWNVHRGITPLTLLALVYSYGVGIAVQERLSYHGLNIRKLQDIHRRLIKRYSVTLTHVTADMSDASNSILYWHLMRLLPRPWLLAVKKAVTHQVMIGDKLHFCESVLPMGNGMTFPLETLIFYALVKAIGNLSGVKGTYSVYGDDLIYPRKIHSRVASIFTDLGMTLNLDKTFVSFPFRESCGEDFYRGVPVRSYYMSNGQSWFPKHEKLEAQLYIMINGLRRRWKDAEIPATLMYLLTELQTVAGHILRVPPSFPDTSGIKVECPNHQLLDSDWFKYAPVHYFERIYGSQWYQFSYLKETPAKRYISSMEPYYWQCLSGDNDEIVPRHERRRDFGYITEPPESPIKWEKSVRKRTYVDKHGRVHKVKRTKYVPFVSSRVIEQYELRGNGALSLSDWAVADR